MQQLWVRNLAPEQVAAVEQLIATYHPSRRPPRMNASGSITVLNELSEAQASAVRGLIASYRTTAGIDQRRIVYMAQHGQSGIIKIGSTVDLKARLRELELGITKCPPGIAPGPLTLLAATLREHGRDAERALHDEFEYLRITGEWFKSSADLLQRARDLGIQDDLPRLGARNGSRARALR